MRIESNVSLKAYNTFGLDVLAEHVVELHDVAQLQEINTDKALPRQRNIVGGGSNILLTKQVAGLTILNKLKGITVEKETADNIWLKVASGEVWHSFVMSCVDKGFAGVENLALIPGTVGASPIQNIGAYGIEAKETISNVNAWHWQDKTVVNYSASECIFGYRDSIFKHELKDKVFILDVTYCLSKNPVFNTSYGAIEQELEKMNVHELSIKAIADAVIAIRSSKLPDPKKIGNAGSFFKNPTIPTSQYNRLQVNNPAMPSYTVSKDMVKIPAAWLIEQCGWKGYKDGNIGVHEKQALVLVNYGGGDGNKIWELSGKIVDAVQQRFDIELEREVQVW